MKHILRLLSLLPIAIVVSVVVSCVDHLPPPGEVIVEVSSDMAIPKDIDTVRVQILSNGTSYNDQAYMVGPDFLHVPATIGILPGADPTTTAIVRVTAMRGGQAVVLREATTEIPSDHVALLRMPLEFLCEGSATDTPQSGLPIDPTLDPITEATCGQGETCVQGTCVESLQAVSALPVYTPQAVFGGGNASGAGGTCFDTLSCFAQAQNAIVQGCTIALPQGTDAADVNVAIETSSDPATPGAGICAGASGGPCFVPIDEDPKDGWQLQGNTVILPPGLCTAIAKGLKASVVLSTACPSKTAATPTCGAWSAVNAPLVTSRDAGTSVKRGDAGGNDLVGGNSAGGPPGGTDASAGCTTTVTGHVYDPEGANPVYPAWVFVPATGTQLPAITSGTNTCSGCNASIGDYTAITTTDATGAFTLTGVPTGTISVVFQLGKWRRSISVATQACQTTTIPAAQSRLPASSAEGDMPSIALLTGGGDDFGCFLRRIGIDASEFTAPGGGGHVAVYQGLAATGSAPTLSNGTAGDCTGSTCPLWASKQALEAYDIVALGCEGVASVSNKPATSIQAMHDWLDEGGRLFATHDEYVWFEQGPADFQGIATWLGASTAAGNGALTVDTTFPMGQELSDFLQSTNGGTIGRLNATEFSSSVSAVGASTTRWLYEAASGNDSGATYDTKALSATTPIGQDLVCGKATFTDIHAGNTPSGNSVPDSCTTNRVTTAQEKALEFLFFNLSACVANGAQTFPGPPAATVQ
jgi:hypothetical protein